MILSAPPSFFFLFLKPRSKMKRSEAQATDSSKRGRPAKAAGPDTDLRPLVEWLSSASYNNAPTDLTFHAPSPDGCALAAVLAAFWGVRNGQGSSGLAAGLAAAVDQVNREPAAAASPVIGALASGLALALAGEAAVTLPDADVLFGLGGRSAHGARAFLATAERSVERIAAALTAGGGRAGGPAGAAGVWAPRDVGAAARAYGCALSGAEAEALHGALVAAARRERTDTASLALPGGFLLAEDARLAPVAFLAAWAGAETHRCCAVAPDMEKKRRP
jgi:hypothetical protein